MTCYLEEVVSGGGRSPVSGTAASPPDVTHVTIPLLTTFTQVIHKAIPAERGKPVSL
jgi:hypothetical protein